MTSRLRAARRARRGRPGSTRPWLAFLAASLLLLGAVGSGTANADATPTLQEEIADSITAQGYWDEASLLDVDVMGDVVIEFGDRFAFAYTDRSFAVEEDPDRSAAALLALSTLDQLGVVGGPRTLLFVTDDDATGASNEFPFANLVSSLSEFDRSNPEESFELAAANIASLGDVIDPQIQNQIGQAGDAGFFSGAGPFVILAIVTGALAVLSLRSAQKKKARKVHTAPARDNTAEEIKEMSDLILDLDPRVVISNDADLKARFVDASDTYRDVLEKFTGAKTGHELADLRIDISKARWKLDVIDAELEGNDPPVEPFTRDVSGSAWDSTRGDGPT